jgi:hypothetical protein
VGHPVRLLIRAAIIAALCLVVLVLFPGWAAACSGAGLILFFAQTAWDGLAPSPRL